MKTRTFDKAIFLATVLPASLVLMTLSGCTDSGDRWNLQFDAKTDAAVRFDVVGINLLDRQDWSGVTMDDYWTNKSNALRANAPRLTFEAVGRKIGLVESKVPGAEQGISGTGSSTITVSRANAAWREWLDRRKAVGLVVIGDFPGASAGAERKRILPLFAGYWDANNHTLQIEIQDGRIQIVTPPSTKAPKYAAKYGF